MSPSRVRERRAGDEAGQVVAGVELDLESTFG
jgi:hypothetical protein